MVVCTFSVRHVELQTPAHRLIRSHDIVDPIAHSVNFLVVALLFTRTTLDQSSRDLLLDAFEHADLDKDSIGDIESGLGERPTLPLS